MILRSDEDASLAKTFYKALELNPEYSLAYFELHHSVANGDLNEAKLHFQKHLIRSNFSSLISI